MITAIPSFDAGLICGIRWVPARRKYVQERLGLLPVPRYS